MTAAMQRVSTCLWFDTQAEQAAQLYTSLFPDSRIVSVVQNADPAAAHPVLVVFTLAGTEFSALNGGPQFPHTEACSLVVACDTQAEIDRVWDALTADGGRPVECGWLKDRYGLSWQIVWPGLLSLLSDPDRAASGRAMAAMMTMKKLDIAALQAAHRE